MLLYTRLAPPKVPKRRSRAGCNYCKEKKKKCDEIRPICSRCQDHGQSCVYEPIKPRQRRRQDSFDDSSVNALSSVALENNSLSRAAQKRMSFEQWEDALLWCSDTYLGNNLTTDGRVQHQASLDKSDEDVDEMGTTWASDTVENDGDLDIAGLNFDAAKGTVRHKQVHDDDDDDDDDQDITLIDDEASRSTSNDSSLAMVASTSSAPPFPAVELVMPAFAEFSPQTNRRALIDHFANVLSHLIVLREDEGNPFQQLVLPLSQKSPVVLNAVFALASAHMEHRGVRNNEKSIHFHNQAIRGLSSMIAKGCVSRRNELLAAIILLVYYEVLVQTGRSNIVDGHLRGAVAIMCNSQAMSDPTGVFLERAFRFYDVITALSFGSTPILPAPDTGNFAPFPPVDPRGATASTGADALLGMATSLWPIIHRLSTLGDMKHELHLAELRGDASKIAILRTEFATTASAVELALQEWALPSDDEGSINTGGKRMQSIVNSAMAYRHSGFVYLYRTIYGRSRRHAVVQRHTHISLLHCIGTVNNEGPMGALLWPLFVASCEAIDPVDREMSRQSFAAVLQRQGMTNIERARCIVEEVWRRADNGEDVEEEITHVDERKKDLWRRVSDDMGVSVVFG
ncbi:fungal-specific transcription factor domain-containing protein [Trichoderma sp. SZMC 28014]